MDLDCCRELKSGLSTNSLAIDIDFQPFLRVARVIVGEGACEKVGKKGGTLFVRCPKTAKLRSTQVKTANKEHVAFDFLAHGKMTVIPPSIHAETGEPYTWVGEPLLQRDLNTLPEFGREKYQLLKTICELPEALVLITGKFTHDDATRLCAKLVSHLASDVQLKDIVAALFPEDYSGNTLRELAEMIASARAKGFDAPLGSERENKTDQAVGLVIKSRD